MKCLNITYYGEAEMIVEEQISNSVQLYIHNRARQHAVMFTRISTFIRSHIDELLR